MEGSKKIYMIDYTPFIVMYTIGKSRSNARNKFHELFVKKFKIDEEEDWLNESTYAVYNFNESCNPIYMITSIIYDMERIYNLCLDKKEDFVDIYYSGSLTGDKKNSEMIIRKNIYPKEYMKCKLIRDAIRKWHSRFNKKG